jgi:hypothetical protein
VRTTSAAPKPKLYATPSFTFGQIGFVSLTNGTLCLSVPVTGSNSGAGSVYAISVFVSISAWHASTGKLAFAIPGHGSKSGTFTVCSAGFTQPRDQNYTVLEPGPMYWGDPNPGSGTANAVSASQGTVDIPR